jgi:hypothetical protein
LVHALLEFCIECLIILVVKVVESFEVGDAKAGIVVPIPDFGRPVEFRLLVVGHATAVKYVLIKCFRICIVKGFEFFEVVDAKAGIVVPVALKLEIFYVAVVDALNVLIEECFRILVVKVVDILLITDVKAVKEEIDIDITFGGVVVRVVVIGVVSIATKATSVINISNGVPVCSIEVRAACDAVVTSLSCNGRSERKDGEILEHFGSLFLYNI